MTSHTISVLVENEFGVLARVAGLFSGRGYNIESLTVNEDPLDPTVSREMVIVKVAVDERTRSELDSIVTAFRAHVIDIGPRAITVELTGDSEKIKAFISIVRPLGIKEVVRSGKVAMARAVQQNADNNHGRRSRDSE